MAHSARILFPALPSVDISYYSQTSFTSTSNHLRYNNSNDTSIMSHFKVDESTFGKLKGAVVVISGKSSNNSNKCTEGEDVLICPTGGATGIGAATVKILSKHGAQVFLGDINTEAAEKLSKECPGVHFVRCDVTKYEDIYNLFKTAYDKAGRIDHAISCAGIYEVGNWFDPDLTIESVKGDSGDLKTLDVNVIGTLHFSRIAAVFLRQGKKAGEDRSLLLLSSVNAFRESPGLFIYQVCWCANEAGQGHGN